MTEQVRSTHFLNFPDGEAAGQLMGGHWGTRDREKQRGDVCALASAPGNRVFLFIEPGYSAKE